MTLFDISTFPFSKFIKGMLPSDYADQFVVKFLRKCLNANTGYKIINNEFKQTIKKIFGLENLKLNSKEILAFSYDTFVFSLYMSAKVASIILFKALIHFSSALGEATSSVITESLPILMGLSWSVISAIIENFLPISSG